MLRFIAFIIVGIITSFYLFPIGFTFLPSTLNTKMMLAAVGVGLVVYRSILNRQLVVSSELLMPMVLTGIFSLVCYISTDVNDTIDYSYASYFLSFLTWLGGAYTVCAVIKWVHGWADFRLLTYYLAGVCFSQCVLAMMIDNIPAFQLLVDSIVSQGQDFFHEVNRLYGIGASLDSAGVRFSLVLVMIAGVLSKDDKSRQNIWTIVFLFIAFFTIVVIGNSISRTTIIGSIAALIYFIASSGLFNIFVKYSSVRLGVVFGVLFLITVIVSVYLYNANEAFYKHMRFAFEGFFNWTEKGEWKTGSTDKLNREMWIWPEDQKTWLIGTGKFGLYEFSTDIGYCRFILYCGLIGFSVFAFLFVYLGMFFASKVPRYWLMFIIFIALAFVFWGKVATDIFFIYALFFCLDQFITDETAGNDETQITYS
ncbi:hypothetical protein VO54_03313 [Elizabethkingia miricola]|nr:hypothetical protein VO54_03313 [Elizabethkingia miricola]